jgi:hypothetical protein
MPRPACGPAHHNGQDACACRGSLRAAGFRLIGGTSGSEAKLCQPSRGHRAMALYLDRLPKSDGAAQTTTVESCAESGKRVSANDRVGPRRPQWRRTH